ncbi:MAG: hypothetical protein MUF77_00345 [Leptospira sp.]|jgi:carbonic anhydrase|nr:hypothetical protein [Leptospira sp.]
MKFIKLVVLVCLFFSLAIYLFFYTTKGKKVQFILGGAMVNLGYRFQDHLEDHLMDNNDDPYSHDIKSPDSILNSILVQNNLSSSVREFFPRTNRHPMITMLICMDSRIDTTEIFGDTRKFYYIIRNAGSTLSDKEEDMIELTVRNGVRLIILTTHTDCAAEKVYNSATEKKHYNALAVAMKERKLRFKNLRKRPFLAHKLDSGELKIIELHVDTVSGKLKNFETKL